MRQFHEYLLNENIVLSELTEDFLDHFLKQKALQPKTSRVYKSQLLMYLDYLYAKKLISFDPKGLRIKPSPLPVPNAAKAFLQTKKGFRSATTTRKFHRWLDGAGIDLKDLTIENVKDNLEYQLKSCPVVTGNIYKSQLLGYLDYLSGEKRIGFDTKPLRIRPDPSPLPEIAYDFLRGEGSDYCKGTLRAFHNWLRSNGITLKEMNPEMLEEFNKHRLEFVTEKTKHNQWLKLLRYLDFLYGNGVIGFNPTQLREEPTVFQLPEEALSFLSNYGAVIKKSTLNGYLTSLRRFYKCLEMSELTLDELKPIHMERFAKWMLDAALCPSTRYGTFVCLRVYFRWLGDHRILSIDSEELIKPEIFPKMPKYLPRPFPQAADIEMQARLSKSDDMYHQGLLLMRYTGVRLGELIGLEFECLQYSHDNMLYLKVPLGKLNNERLVPIDDKTHEIIKGLKSGRPPSSKHLLETPRGKKTNQVNYSKALKEISTGLDLHGPAQTHRLRHTYATSMLNGGMSLVGLMKLLGHHDHRMTLRYSAITTETVRDEYMDALGKLQNRYKDVSFKTNQPKDPRKQINDAIKWVQKNCISDNDEVNKRLGRIILRLQRAETALGMLMKEAFDT